MKILKAKKPEGPKAVENAVLIALGNLSSWEVWH